jgi:hypothetical protein
MTKPDPDPDPEDELIAEPPDTHSDGNKKPVYTNLKHFYFKCRKIIPYFFGVKPVWPSYVL